jgi:hypothetical protein
MKSRYSQLPLSQRLLPFAIAIVCILGFLPARYIAWISWFRSPVMTLVAPISGPLHALGAWMRPAEPPVDSDAARALREQRDYYQQLYLQKAAEVTQLSGVIAELQRIRAAYPGLDTKLIPRPVIASASDLAQGSLAIRIGADDGVSGTTVATIRGVQLIGRVHKVQSRICYILPINHKSAGSIGTRIYLNNHPQNKPISLSAVMKPVGDGTLSGDVEYEVDNASLQPYQPQVGDRVRLDDMINWPQAAQHILIGEVISAEPSQAKPGRTTVIVRPSIPQLDRVGDVTLLISGDEPPVEGGRK